MTQLFVNEVGDKLETSFRAMFDTSESARLACVKKLAGVALGNIGRSDALYHDVEHTARVTLVGLQILIGKHLSETAVTPHEWTNVVAALLCHDVGYVRGICLADDGDQLANGIAKQTTQVSVSRSDAALMPIHVDRGKLFVEQDYGIDPMIDVPFVQACIERTRFPVPKEPWYQQTGDYPGLVRAADLIGQLSDPAYLTKLSAVFYEFVEVGFNEKLGYEKPGDLLDAYPTFFEQSVVPYIDDALGYLDKTPLGKETVENLYANLDAARKPERLRMTG